MKQWKGIEMGDVSMERIHQLIGRLSKRLARTPLGEDGLVFRVSFGDHDDENWLWCGNIPKSVLLSVLETLDKKDMTK